MKLSKLVVIPLMMLLVGCSWNKIDNHASQKNKLVNLQCNEKSLGNFIYDQFEGNKYEPIFLMLNENYYSSLQAIHYILISRIVGNEISQEDLDLYKQEAVNQGDSDFCSIADTMTEENLFNEEELADLKEKYYKVIEENQSITDDNWFDLYYGASILNRIDGFDATELANKFREYSNSIEDKIDKLQMMYCYCSLLSKMQNYDFKNDTQIKNLLLDLKDNKDLEANLSYAFVYYSMLNMLDMREYGNSEFLDSLEKGLYDTLDNLSLDSIYIKAEILKQADPSRLDKHKENIIRFLNSFKNDKVNVMFPRVVGGSSTPVDYYPCKIVLENYLSNDETPKDMDAELNNLNFKLKNAEGLTVKGLFYKLLYNKFNGIEINKNVKESIQNQIKKMDKEILFEGHIFVYIWHLLGNDVEELLDNDFLIEKLNSALNDKYFSEALIAIDLLNLSGYDNEKLSPYLETVNNELKNNDYIQNSHLYLLHLLRYKIQGIKLTSDEIDKIFDVNYLADDFPVVGNGSGTRYLEINDYLYYYSLKYVETNDMLAYVR